MRVTPDAQVCCVQHAVDLVLAEAPSQARVDQLADRVLFQQRAGLLQTMEI
jgi:hypothetical protein